MFGALEAKVIERRGKEVAEAVLILVLAVRSLERSVAEATEPAIVESREAILRDARRLTGHSLRPTFPMVMALGGSASLPIHLQGN